MLRLEYVDGVDTLQPKPIGNATLGEYHVVNMFEENNLLIDYAELFEYCRVIDNGEVYIMFKDSLDCKYDVFVKRQDNLYYGGVLLNKIKEVCESWKISSQLERLEL